MDRRATVGTERMSALGAIFYYLDIDLGLAGKHARGLRRKALRHLIWIATQHLATVAMADRQLRRIE